MGVALGQPDWLPHVEPLTVEPTQQHGNCTWVVAQSVAGTVDQPQFGSTVGFCHLARILGGNGFIIVAMHHQQWSRCEPSSGIDRPEPAQLARPLIELFRVAGCANGTDLSGVFSEPARLGRPVVEVGSRAQQSGTAYPRIVGTDTHGN